MKSLLQKEKECFICKSTQNLQCHHVFYGTANRKLSEKYGMKIWLCMEHHTGSRGVHFNKEMDQKIKEWAQGKWEELYSSRRDFIATFGRSWL